MQKMKSINWSYKYFTELTTNELYDILWLRSRVFVVEQNCVYLDVDYKDQKSYHLMGTIDGKLVAYVRILPPGLSFEEASIGRVLTNPDCRGNGYGIELMKLAIDKTLEQYNVKAIRIGAQCYLNKFYQDLGFVNSGEEFLEDGIPHIEMLLSL
jgi:ElaA protein